MTCCIHSKNLFCPSTSKILLTPETKPIMALFNFLRSQFIVIVNINNSLKSLDGVHFFCIPLILSSTASGRGMGAASSSPPTLVPRPLKKRSGSPSSVTRKYHLTACNSICSLFAWELSCHTTTHSSSLFVTCFTSCHTTTHPSKQ